MANTVAEAVIRRDRNVVIVGLTAVIMVSAIYTINITRVLVGSISVLHHSAYTQHGFLLVFIMWTVMQIAMMSRPCL